MPVSLCQGQPCHSLKEGMSSLDKVKNKIFVKVQRLWVVGHIFQPWKVNVFWVISPHTEGDDKEYRRYTQTSASASCPPLPSDGGLQDEVQASGDAS